MFRPGESYGESMEHEMETGFTKLEDGLFSTKLAWNPQRGPVEIVGFRAWGEASRA